MEREFLYSKKRCLNILPCYFLEEVTISKNEKAFCTRVYSVKKICGHIWVNVWIFNFTESTTSHLCMQPCSAVHQNNLINISLVHATLQCYGSKQSDQHLTCACNPAVLCIKTIYPLLRISTNILQYCKVTTTVQYSFMLTHNWKDHRLKKKIFQVHETERTRSLFTSCYLNFVS